MGKRCEKETAVVGVVGSVRTSWADFFFPVLNFSSVGFWQEGCISRLGCSKLKLGGSYWTVYEIWSGVADYRPCLHWWFPSWQRKQPVSHARMLTDWRCCVNLENSGVWLWGKVYGWIHSTKAGDCTCVRSLLPGWNQWEDNRMVNCYVSFFLDHLNCTFDDLLLYHKYTMRCQTLFIPTSSKILQSRAWRFQTL